MDGNYLYDILGVTKESTPEQIRSAYRKKALQTHPDRAPVSEKQSAEDQFRLVNNAYEVLNDPDKRKQYDREGKWPPEQRQGPDHHGFGFGRPFGYRHHPHASFPYPSRSFFFPFSHGFSNMHGHGHGRNSFRDEAGFTDPFTLFNSIFGDLNHAMNDPFDPWNQPHHHPMSMFANQQRHMHDMHSQMMQGAFSSPFFPAGPSQQRALGSSSISTSTGRVGGSGNVRWVSESRMSSSINGMTQSVWKRVDSDGNQHVTQTFPDGREVYTINGVQQQVIGGPNPQAALPAPPDQQYGPSRGSGSYVHRQY